MKQQGATLERDSVMTVRAGSISLRIVCDEKNRVGVVDGRGAWVPPHDGDRDYVFPVYEQGAAFSDLGSQADSMISDIDGEEFDTDLKSYDLHKFVQILFWLVRIHPLLPSLLVVKAKDPTISTRALGKHVGLGRSQISDLMGVLEQKFPRAFSLITGSKAKAVRGQRLRRARESGLTPTPRVGSSEPGGRSGVLARRQKPGAVL